MKCGINMTINRKEYSSVSGGLEPPKWIEHSLRKDVEGKKLEEYKKYI